MDSFIDTLVCRLWSCSEHKIMEKGDNSLRYIVLFSGILKKFSANKILSLVYLNGVLQILHWYESTLVMYKHIVLDFHLCDDAISCLDYIVLMMNEWSKCWALVVKPKFSRDKPPSQKVCAPRWLKLKKHIINKELRTVLLTKLITYVYMYNFLTFSCFFCA